MPTSTVKTTAAAIAIAIGAPCLRPIARRISRKLVPRSRSAGAQTRAEPIFAIQNARQGISMIPATSGMAARTGPKKRPINTLAEPKRSKKR